MVNDIELLNPADFYNKDLPQEQALQWFQEVDASWVHDGNVKKPHAELTSGNCSNGYFNCSIPLSYPNVSKILARQLAQRIRQKYAEKIDWVIGSPMAGITFAHDMAHELGAKRSAFVEKDPHNKGSFLWKRFQIPAGDTVLQIEELTTTSHTLCGVRRAIDAQNIAAVKWVPFVGILVHRPPRLPIASYDDRQIVTFIEREVWSVPKDECTLCQKGSRRYRPKENWKELTA